MAAAIKQLQNQAFLLQSFDINGDGYITKAELMDVLCKKGDSPLSEEVVSISRKIDRFR